MDSVRLSPADAAALDALMDAGLDVDRIADADIRRRAGRIAAILGLLNSAPSSQRNANTSLDPVAAASVDRFVDGRNGTGGSLDRAHEAIASLLRSGPSHASSARVSDTAALVVLAMERDRMRFPEPARGAGWRRRFWDTVAVAASFVVLASIAWPALVATDMVRRRTICQANMREVASALGAYAGSNRDSLPLATASLLPAGRWWDVGTERSNSANLFALVRSGFVAPGALACPGIAYGAGVSDADCGRADWRCFREVPFAFQVMRGACSTKLQAGPKRVVLSDRSPIVARLVARTPADPMESSWAHRGRGQSALFTDGSVVWLKKPILENGDNIWLPRTIERVLAGPRRDALTGEEGAAADDDAFVGP